MACIKLGVLAAALVAAFSAHAEDVRQQNDDLGRALAKPGQYTISAGLTHEGLTKGRGVWNGVNLMLEDRLAPRTMVYGGLEQTNKFKLDDTKLILGAYYPLPKDILLNVEGTYSGTHHVIAEDSLMGSLQFPIAKGWLLTGGLKYADYANGVSTQEFGTLEWYYQDFRTALTVTDTQSQGENMVGGRVSVSKYYNDISYVTLSLGSGREVDRSGNNNIVFLNTNSIGLNGRHWFSQNWALNWALMTGEEGNAYRHTGVSLGLRHNF